MLRIAAPAFVYLLALLNVQLGGTAVKMETQNREFWCKTYCSLNLAAKKRIKLQHHSKTNNVCSRQNAF
jgi:hypothetical protein